LKPVRESAAPKLEEYRIHFRFYCNLKGEGEKYLKKTFSTRSQSLSYSYYFCQAANLGRPVALEATTRMERRCNDVRGQMKIFTASTELPRYLRQTTIETLSMDA
jgi:hypothetical protein